MQARQVYPDTAFEWMLGTVPARVLTLSSAKAVTRIIADHGHEVHALENELTAAHKWKSDGRINSLVATANALPYEPQTFDFVLIHQLFDKLNPQSTLAEMTRVLRPHGWVTVSYLARDDSVPWVHRLTDLIRTLDPEALTSNPGDKSIQALLKSKYFPHYENKDFRVWVPVQRAQIVEMVRTHPAVAALSDPEIAELLAKAAEIYEVAARGAELRLPYQLRCWRASVDQNELTTPIRFPDDALVIPI